MMENCIFCKIAAGEIPSACLYDGDGVYAFKDINPQAPVHFLVIPKEHIKDASCINAENAGLVAHCLEVAALVAKQEGLDNGFRIVSNCGEDAGQTVHHLHFHVLGGKTMSLEMA